MQWPIMALQKTRPPRRPAIYRTATFRRDASGTQVFVMPSHIYTLRCIAYRLIVYKRVGVKGRCSIDVYSFTVY